MGSFDVEKDADTRELARYFSDKSDEAVSDGLAYVDSLVERAARLLDALEGNSSLGNHCGIDRCLRGNRPRCRACRAAETCRQLVRRLEELQNERTRASLYASELRMPRER